MGQKGGRGLGKGRWSRRGSREEGVIRGVEEGGCRGAVEGGEGGGSGNFVRRFKLFIARDTFFLSTAPPPATQVHTTPNTEHGIPEQRFSTGGGGAEELYPSTLPPNTSLVTWSHAPGPIGGGEGGRRGGAVWVT